VSALDNLKSGGGSTASVSGKVFLDTPGGTKTITLKRSGKKITSAIEGAGAVTIADAKKRYFEDPTVQSGWLFTLRKNGFGDVSPAKGQALYEMAVEGASKFYSQSGGTQKITPEQYVQWYAKDQGVLGGGGPSVSVQKYLFQPEEIQSLIDSTLKGVLGRKATQAESKEFYTAIQDMIDKGTVTTTKKVGGKTITEIKPGYSKEKAEALITERVKAQSPQDYEEAQSLGFADFLGKLKG
jgi:hypothetical protein